MILSVLYFAISVMAEANILDGQLVKKRDITLKQLHLQIILIERD